MLCNVGFGVMVFCVVSVVWCFFFFFPRGVVDVRTPYPLNPLIFCQIPIYPVRNYVIGLGGGVVLCTVGWYSPYFSERGDGYDKASCGDGSGTLQKLRW